MLSARGSRALGRGSSGGSRRFQGDRMQFLRVAALQALLAGAASAQAAAQAPDPEAARLCANQDPCRVAQRTDAGRGVDGQALAIVERTLGETNAEGRPC